MKKAFIFDVDGVLMNNEPVWEQAKEKIFIRLCGPHFYDQIKPGVGLSIEALHKKALQNGATFSFRQLYEAFDSEAEVIYQKLPITDGIQMLGQLLTANNFAIGVVSASPRHWIDLVINRLSFKENIAAVISLDERKDLDHKPSPAGYLEVMKICEVLPENTFILEDSNNGIASAKAAGAYVIGLKQNLLEGYAQEGADTYVDSVDEITAIIENNK